MVVRTRRFDRTEYHRLAEAGLLGEDDRVELLEGTVATMSPIGPHHSAVVRYLIQFFTTALGRRAIVDAQNPLAVDEFSEPQPDLMLLKPRDDFYRQAHPGPADVLLLIEVAEASVELDREYKARLYARAGISEYWVVDLVRRAVVVHRRPSGEFYQDAAEHGRSKRVSPAAFPDVELPVAECLG